MKIKNRRSKILLFLNLFAPIFICIYLMQSEKLYSQSSNSPFSDTNTTPQITASTDINENNYEIEYLGEGSNTSGGVGQQSDTTAGSSNQKPKTKIKKYRVKRGDTLWDIASRFLGDARRFYELVQLNKNKYPSLTKNPNIILEGWELELPEDAQNPASDGEQEVTYTNSESGVVEVSTSLNVRTSPWGKIIGRLHNQDRVEIIGEKGDWYKIKYNGQIAYVHSNYVTTSKKKAGTTPVKYPSHPTNTAIQEHTTTVTQGSGRFGAPPCTPMPSYASSEFGPRDLFGHRFHYGIDLPVLNGTRVNALGDGIVTAVGYEPGGGTYVIIRYDNGLESFYCHLQSYSVRVGQRVYMGQEVARSDNTGAYTTGPHLHMEIRRNGQKINPRSVPGLPLPPR